jgi:hypothetical protein
MDARVLDRAKRMTEKLFYPLQIEILWIDCLAEPTPQNQRCISPSGPNDISVRIYRRSTKDRQRLGAKTAGLALPLAVSGGSGFIQVFFERLEEICRDGSGATRLELLLSTTIAHEMGHLLLPHGQHQSSGIMQGCLGGRNLLLAAKGWMRFTTQERQAIRKNVRNWSNLSERQQFASLHR